MESDGKYALGNYVCKRPDCYALESPRDVIIANLSYAEGRKSMEKDFKELLEIIQWLDDDSGYESAATKSFRAWKKARGIE